MRVVDTVVKTELIKSHRGPVQGQCGVLTVAEHEVGALPPRERACDADQGVMVQSWFRFPLSRSRAGLRNHPYTPLR